MAALCGSCSYPLFGIDDRDLYADRAGAGIFSQSGGWGLRRRGGRELQEPGGQDKVSGSWLDDADASSDFCGCDSCPGTAFGSAYASLGRDRG